MRPRKGKASSCLTLRGREWGSAARGPWDGLGGSMAQGALLPALPLLWAWGSQCPRGAGRSRAVFPMQSLTQCQEHS